MKRLWTVSLPISWDFSIVWRLSLIHISYEQVSADIKGHTGVKLHTGEQNGPNIIPREWVKALFRKDLSEANIVETNTYYEGDRYTTEQHRRTLEVNGWTFCPVDILDEEDTLTLPVHGGKWFGRCV